jgi:tRNA 2-thiouridine synthesizing protein A
VLVHPPGANPRSPSAPAAGRGAHLAPDTGAPGGPRPDRALAAQLRDNHGFPKEVTTMQFDKELDARGLSCPLPILKTKKALGELASGQVLKVVSTDPGSVKDMQAFANQTGNPLLESAEENKDFVFYLKKK